MREILEIPIGKWKLHGMAHIRAETRGRRIGVVMVGPTPKFGTHRLLLARDANAGAKKPEERFDGLILCDLLSHPSQTRRLPQLAYGRLAVRTAVKNVFLNENPAQKLWKVVRRSENWLRKGPTLIRRLVGPEQVLDQLRKAPPRVGELPILQRTEPGPGHSTLRLWQYKLGGPRNGLEVTCPTKNKAKR